MRSTRFRRRGGGTGGSGRANFLPRVNVGVRVQTVLNALVGRFTAGVSFEEAPQTLLTKTTPAVAFTTRNQGTVKPQVSPGISIAGRNAATVKVPVGPAVELQRISYALIGDYGANLTGQELLLKDAILSTPNLRSYWRLDEASGSALDSGPDNFPGTPAGSPVRDVTGLVGAAAGNDGAVTFDSGDDRISMGDVHDLTGAHTVELLARLNGAPAADGDYNLLFKVAAATGWALSIVRLLGVNRFRAWVNGSTVEGGTIANSTITHLAKTFAGTTLTLYQDGAQSAVNTTSAAPLPSTAALFLRAGTAQGQPHTNTTVDEVAIFNRALDAAEITFHNSVRLGASTGDWTNLANAQGKRNGTLASIPGNALAPRAGNLILDYADFPNKTALAITKVELRFYTRRNNVASLGTFMDHRYRFGASQEWTILEQYSGLLSEHNHLTTPETYDLTAAVGGDWAKLNSLQCGVFANVGILAILGDTVECDAVELHVEASVVDNL